MKGSWANSEIKIIVSDYFEMLFQELKGISFNKSEHRKRILHLLNDRSEGSVEFKHQNISAVLINLGRPYISGYLPRYNYQNLLKFEVIDYLIRHPEIESFFLEFAENDIKKSQKKYFFEKMLVSPPEIISVKDPEVFYPHKLTKVNYLEREQSNKLLGIFGEEIVIKYEKWTLINAGKENLADKIEWISREIGDYAGFDILSRNLNGTDKYIEVKTTKLGKESPFFFSSHELQFSLKKASDYHLYRLFNAKNNVKLFTKKGALNTICRSVPIMFKGYF
jgi:hypothetical protein